MTFSSIGTISRNQNPPSHSMVGDKRGETTSRELAGSTLEIAEWLASKPVSDVDKAAVLRANSHGVALKVETDLRFPTGPNGEYLPSYEVSVGCSVSGTDGQRQAALVDLRKFQTPAPTRQIENWLAELSVLTAGRSREGMDAALTMNAYSSRLKQYPADVTKYALLQHSWKWWPTWDELRKVCDAKAGPRHQMIHGLSQPAPKPVEKRRPATQEERDRIQAMVDKMFPLRSPDMRKAAVDEALKGNCMGGAA